MTLHCMIDLETLGRKHDAAIVQIGWCLFDEDVIRLSFKANVNLEDALAHGSITADTFLWWIRQSQEARDSVFSADSHETLQSALNNLAGSIKAWSPQHFWAHATFDFPILTNAFAATGIANPIGFRQCRDLRTLDMLAHAKTIADWPAREGTYHDAQDDAVHQAKCVQLMLKKIGWKE